MKTCNRCLLTKEVSLFCKNRNTCLECKRSHKRNWYAVNKANPQSRYNNLIGRARHINRVCDIELSTYIDIISKPCHYCGNSIASEVGGGLDRLNLNIGYTANNVVPCCGSCNSIRGDKLTHDEMIVAMKAILAYRALPSTITQ